MTNRGNKFLQRQLATEKLKVKELIDAGNNLFKLSEDLKSEIEIYKEHFLYISDQKFFKAFKHFRLMRKNYKKDETKNIKS